MEFNDRRVKDEELPSRTYDVGKYSITYGYNPHTKDPEAWAESWKTYRSHCSSLNEDNSVTHGTRGTNPVPDKYAQKHIEKTLRQMARRK